MTNESKRAGPFARRDLSIREAIAEASEAAASSGLPSSYVSLSHTRLEHDDGRAPLERLLIDIEGSDVHGELETTSVVRSLNGGFRVSTTRRTWYRRSLDSADAVLDEIRSSGLEPLCARQNWYRSSGLVTGDWNYWIDPANPWPLWWSALACDVALGEGGPPGGRDGDSGLPNEVAWAAHMADGTVGLMPFVAIRVKQDLIRLDPGRLRRLDERTEQAIVPFTLGSMGWNYVLSNSPELRFKLLGENQTVNHEGVVRLGDDELKYGVFLTAPEGMEDRRIFGTDLVLLLNGIVVDRSVGAYIRSIKISIARKQG